MDEAVHEDDGDDVVVAVILDSKLKKGRIEIRKVLKMEETGLLFFEFLG